jgi:hypothetical protein
MICLGERKRLRMLWGVFSLGFVYSDMMILCWLCNVGRRRQAGQWNCSRSCLPTYCFSLCSPYCTSSRRHESKHVIASSKPEFVLTGPGGGGGVTALSYCRRREQRENDAGIGRWKQRFLKFELAFGSLRSNRIIVLLCKIVSKGTQRNCIWNAASQKHLHIYIYTLAQAHSRAMHV